MQVIHAIMAVTPWVRLSEEVLATSVLAFYRKHTLIPPGVSEVALDPWAQKMSFGAHKIVRRFRKLFYESPEKSRSEELQKLKDRCLASGVQIPDDFQDDLQSRSSSRTLSSEDLGELPSASAGPAVDWALVLQRLKEKPLQKKNVAVEEDNNLKVAQNAQMDKSWVVPQRPLPTPVRAPHVPDFVLQGIAQKQAPVPFATTGGNEDDGAPEADDDGIAATAKKKAKKTTQSTQRNTKKQKKKVNEAALMAEVENGLKPPLPAAEVENGLKPPLPAAECLPLPSTAGGQGDAGCQNTYVAGDFSQKRKAFIFDLRQSGVAYKDANNAWMMSNIRASLLENMSPAEMKKRRFA